MIRRLLIAAGALAALGLSSAQTALAESGDMVQGVEVHVAGMTGPARAGQVQNLTFSYKAMVPTVLRGFAYAMRGASPTSDATHDSVTLTPGQIYQTHLPLTPGVPDELLQFSVVVNGRKQTFFRDMSQANWDRTHRFMEMEPDPGAVAHAAPSLNPATQWSPAPQPKDYGSVSAYGNPVTSMEAARKRAPSAQQVAGTFHLYGTMRYERPSPLDPVGIDGASYAIWLISPFGDIPMATGVTGWDGSFDKTIAAFPGGGNHFYITVWSDNHFVHVTNNNDHDDSYKWRTKDFYADLNGSNSVSFYCDQSHLSAAFNLLTVGVRMFRWVFTNTHFTEDDIDDVGISYPESDWPHYTWPILEELYIPNTSWAWNDGTILHELGHHACYELPMDIVNTDYDDGVCNNPNGDPGHCQWCAEADIHVAYMEGFATYFSDLITRHWKDTYGQDPSQPENVEALPRKDCDGKSCSCDPYYTEGNFSVLLRDFDDDENEPDSSAWDYLHGAAVPEDRISLGGANILYMLCDYSIKTTQQAINALNSRFGGSFAPADMWSTFANAGFQLDHTPPSPPTNFFCNSHALNYPSPNTNLSIRWDPALDDYSGPYKYDMGLTKDGASSYFRIVNGAGLAQTFSDLPPGSYTLTIHTKDNAGNYGTDNVVGPWIVRLPYPSDLTTWTRTGWTYFLVPRGTLGATGTSCVLPATLPGNRDTTYFNWAIQNGGEVLVDTTWYTRLLVDGVPIDSMVSSPGRISPNSQTALNRGPRLIRGGRHTVELWIDAHGAVAESNELNNRVGKQFCWTPLSLGWNTPTTRPTPPDPHGGFNSFSVPIGQFKWNNCDGLTYSHNRIFPFGSSNWMAVDMHVVPNINSRLRDLDNYDMFLYYNDFDGSEGGFSGTGGLTGSTRGAGYLDALITNSASSSVSVWDVGVEKTGGSNQDYIVRANPAILTNVGDSVAINAAVDQMLLFRELNVTAANSGRITVEIRQTSGNGPVRLAWYTPGFNFGSLDNAYAAGTTDGAGVMKLSIQCIAGSHALAIYRDPRSGTGAWGITLKIYREPTDAAETTPTGWHASLTPRATNDGTVVSVPAPTILYGDDHSTWFNVAWSNLSGQTSGAIPARVLVDAKPIYSTVFPSIPAFSTIFYPNRFPSVVPGGRHVAQLQLDPAGLVPELSETNNNFGEQWVWMPDTLAPNSVQWRAGQIGGQTAGWESCAPDEALGFDCDGVRLPLFAAASGVNWTAVAVTSRDSSDVDLALHDMTVNPNSGFDSPLEFSNWGRGCTELLVTNFLNGYRKLYDVGIYRVSNDTSSYVVNFVTGAVRDPNAALVGPFTLGANRLVDVHEFQLPVGQHKFHLRNLAGSVNWVLAAYNTVRPFQDRSGGKELAWSVSGGPGADEEVTFPVTSAGSYAVVVYKDGTADRGLSGDYRLEHNLLTTTVDGSAPSARTALLGAQPSPFRGSTSLAFDLASAGPVSLDVFDVSGKKVRSILSGVRAAGRQRADWDGADDSGRRLPNGVYLARLQAGAYSGVLKVVRIN